MKRAWAAQMEIWEEIDRICKANNIKYFAEYGTLLGAFRQKGFIPWDDDLNIGMLRPDFERFYRIFTEKAPKHLLILSIKNENLDEHLIRIVNTDRIRWDDAFLEKYHGCPYAMGVDVFVRDNIPDNKGEEQELLNLIRITDTLGKRWNGDPTPLEEKVEMVKQLQAVTGYSFQFDKDLPPQILKLSDLLYSMYSDTETKEVTFLNRLIRNANYRLPREVFADTVELAFEHVTIPAPVGYEQVLRLQYRDYMTPVQKWYTHSYPFFAPQIRMLRDLCAKSGETIPDQFDMRLEGDNC